MTLAVECVIVCVLYGVILVGLVLKNKEAWLYEYAPEVQKRYLENNPGHTAKQRTKQPNAVIAGKIVFCVVCSLILAGLAYFAGARGFLKGALYSYLIWSSVNIFDAIILDLGIFAHWKKIRLPGTEDMNKEYTSNKWKDIKGGIVGQLIGIPVACLCSILVILFSMNN